MNDAWLYKTIADNQTTEATLITIPVRFNFAEILYMIERGSNKEFGRIFLAHDGVNVGLTQYFAEVNTSGVTLTSIIDSGNMLLQYTSTSTGTAGRFRYKIERFT